MKIEVGERKTLEFKKNEYRGTGSLLPVSIYEHERVDFELLEINKSLAKSLIPFIHSTENENAFITIIRISLKSYLILPGAAIIEKVGKSVSA
ncbi:MAG: hypothetical protein M1535_02170 [Candidatus Thermoplasmatota archaeon]|jgi:hypothetical protein|nr:hypothetical protein [Candidatus Thermoplasmatota archaeon]